MKTTLTDTEWKVMNVLWESDEAVSARVVHGEVEAETEWAYDTVRTILNRLAQKGIVHSEIRRGTAYFEPILSREEARRSALSWITEKAFDGAYGSLMQFLVGEKELSEKDRKELKRLLSELEKE